MGIVETIALTMGVAWASGINLYATLAMLGILGATGNIVLPQQLAVLTDPMVIGAACFMYFVEFFADKTPGIDTGWDSIHTFIRIPAGAILAAGAVGDVTPAVALTAAILGGTLATTAHATKAGGRVLINTSPEPVSNWTASITEDVLVIGGLWAALHHPWLFFVLLALFVGLMIWLLPKIMRGVRNLAANIGRLFSARRAEPDAGAARPVGAPKALPPSSNGAPAPPAG